MIDDCAAASSAPTSASTARIAAAASALMSGARSSWPGVLAISAVDDWIRALRYSAVAAHADASSGVPGFPLLVPRRRHATWCSAASTSHSWPGRRARLCCVLGWPSGRVMSCKTRA
eukprot:6017690-Prymnesium_polylepis.2